MIPDVLEEKTPSMTIESLRKKAWVDWILAGVSLLIVGWVVAEAAIARTWPLVHDAPLMHYVVFLMERGFVPYRDIVDMNMPGSYIFEWAVMHTLGEGARAWYLWDVLTGVTAIAASMWIAGSKKRWAGVAAGGLMYVYHLSDGAWNLGQRDWTVAVLLLIGLGFLFTCIRRREAVWVAGFVCFCGLACSIKPLAALMVIVFLPALLWVQRGPQSKVAATLGWAAAGAVLPAGMVIWFLSHWHVWPEFFAVLHGLVPYYAGLAHLGYVQLLKDVAPPRVKVLVLGAVYLFWKHGSWRFWDRSVASRDWEPIFLAMASLCGFAFFLIQRKGWSYHSYSAVGFALLWAMVEVDTEFRRRNERAYVAMALLVVAAFLLPKTLLAQERENTYPMGTVQRLESDLDGLGGQQLSGQVQCLDMTRVGCIGVLYEMKLVQATGFIYDFYLFPEKDTAVTRELQQRFLEKMKESPPKVIVLSSHIWPGDTYGYEELSRWPAFEDFLERSYQPALVRPRIHRAMGYEVFVLK